MSYQVNVNNRTYTVVNDLTTFYHVFITGSATDELTGESLTGAFTVLSDLMGVFIKVMEGGLFCDMDLANESGYATLWSF